MRFSKNILILMALTLVAGVFAVDTVGAQASNSNAAQGLQISPTRIELNAAPGKTYNVSLKVVNITASELVYTSVVQDFNAANETGSPHIFTDNDLSDASSIRTWVSTIPTFTLRSHESRTIEAQINIPNNAEPGGHYGALLFSGVAPELGTTGVGLSASNGPLILIRVDGKVTEKAELSSFYSSQSGKQSWFFENGPVTFVTRIKNEGNIHIKPTGSIEIRDWFGNLVSNLPVNKEKSNVLPDSTRRFENNLDKTWMFGLYTVNLALGYGNTGQAITNTISFWVIPYKLIFVVLLAIFVTVLILKRIIKAYNKRIIEKAKNENKKGKQNKDKA